MECCKVKSKKQDYSFINHYEEELFHRKDDMKCVASHPCNVVKTIIKHDKKKGLFQIKLDFQTLGK